MATAQGRLFEERKSWRKDHPQDFVAKPLSNPTDGSVNYMRWETLIPGKAGTLFEGGLFRVDLLFTADYPNSPPTCKFVPPLFHPNVFTNGDICLSIINPSQGWKPSITIKQIVLGIQELLDSPNPSSPANGEANNLFLRNKKQYDARIKAQTKLNIPSS